MAAIGVGHYRDACAAIERAAALAPANPEYHAQHARCLALLLQDGQARAAAERAEALAPTRALTLDTIGVVWSRLGEHERAAAVFERAVAAAPDQVGYRYNLATALRILGAFADAEREYEHVVRLAPRFYKAHTALSDLRSQTAERNHIERLTALLTGVGNDPDGELRVRHALAKELEDLGEHDRAFAQLAAGKARKRAALQYSFAADEAIFAALEAAFDATSCRRSDEGCPSHEPIFVVGLPRSGTTLVERILSSHSEVSSVGELHTFGACLKRAAGTSSKRVLDPETIQRGLRCDMGALGRQYVDSTRPLTRSKPRFVDKMPLNFFYVGFIHFALPNSKIVCVRREPLDSCLSLYRQLLADTPSYYDFALDLADVGRYYARFDRLIAHWQRVLPGRVIEVQYEALVRDQERETRRLLELCELPWQAACLDFHVNSAPVATASSVQARAPLYGTSIGRWRRYAAHLEPLRQQLEAAGIALPSE